MNTRKILDYGLITVKVLLAVLLALTAFSCDDANGNGTKVQPQQVTLPQGLQGKTYAQSDGGSITFASDTVTVTGTAGIPKTYKIKSQERSGNKTKLYFNDNKSRDYIVVSDNGTIEEVVFDEVSGEGEWTYSSGNNPGGPEFDDTQVKIYFYYNNGETNDYHPMALATFGANVPQNVRTYYVPKKEEYDFTGWYTERDGDTLYDFDAILSKEIAKPQMENIDEAIVQTGWYINVYAGWKPHVYTFEELCFKFMNKSGADYDRMDGIYGRFIFEEDLVKTEGGVLENEYGGFVEDEIESLESFYYVYLSAYRQSVYATPHFGFSLYAYTYGADVGNEINDYIFAHEYLKDDPRLPLNIVKARIGVGYYKDNKDATLYTTVVNGIGTNPYNIVVTDSEGMFKVKSDNAPLDGHGDKVPWLPSVDTPTGYTNFFDNCSSRFYPGRQEYYNAWLELVETINPCEFVITGFEYDYEKGRLAWIELGDHAFMKPGKYVYYEQYAEIDSEGLNG